MNSGLRIWHPFTQEALDPPPIRIASAQGAYLYTDDGRRLIDGISSWWVNIHGHCHPAIMDAIAEQTKKLDHVLLAGFTHEGVEELVPVACGMFLPARARTYFLFRQWFDGRGSGAEDGRAVLAEHRAPGKKVDCGAGTCVPRGYGGCDVCERAIEFYGPVSRADVSGASRPFGLLLSLPRGEETRNLRH